MCGIAGFTRFHHSTGDADTLRRMGEAILHRGPDDGGVYLDDGVGLCHRRLSIIDLSAAGHQPMFSADDNLVIAFNGEIYNFLELKEELVAKGYPFRSKTDTEVLLALYQFEGEKMVERINGMFAFAIWDKSRRELFLARDRLGKKPLYYYQKDGFFIFGSELKSIIELPMVSRQIRVDAVYDFFTYQYVPDPKSIFEDIYKLEPAHCMTISAEKTVKRQYWDLTFSQRRQGSDDAIATELLDLVDGCVKRRMVSDVPLGAFLSGGVDSSAVVGLMAKNSETPVTTCTIGFASEQFDEVEFAKQVAEQFKTDHHEFTVRENVSDNLEKIAAYFDEPFADPSLVPTYFVSQLARKQVTVALAGDGGDESFAGYSKYAIDELENRLRSLFPAPLRRKVFPWLAGLLQKSDATIARKAATLLGAMAREPAYGFFLTNSFMTDEVWNRLVRDDFRQSLSGYHPSSVTLEHYHNVKAGDHLSRILYTDIKTYLPGDILVKVDRMSMANSLEVRAPLLDYQVVEFAASIPSRLKLDRGEKKVALKKAFAKLLTHDTLYRKKMGFSVPLASWLRNEIRAQAERLLLQSPAGLQDYFKLDELRRVWDAHQSGARDYSSELWSMIMFQLWFDRYGPRSATV